LLLVYMCTSCMTTNTYHLSAGDYSKWSYKKFENIGIVSLLWLQVIL